MRRSSISCETDSPMGRAHGGLYAKECDTVAARLIHPWGEPMGVCTQKSATVIDWRILTRFHTRSGSTPPSHSLGFPNVFSR